MYDGRTAPYNFRPLPWSFSFDIFERGGRKGRHRDGREMRGIHKTGTEEKNKKRLPSVPSLLTNPPPLLPSTLTPFIRNEARCRNTTPTTSARQPTRKTSTRKNRRKRKCCCGSHIKRSQAQNQDPKNRNEQTTPCFLEGRVSTEKRNKIETWLG